MPTAVSPVTDTVADDVPATRWRMACTRSAVFGSDGPVEGTTCSRAVVPLGLTVAGVTMTTPGVGGRGPRGGGGGWVARRPRSGARLLPPRNPLVVGGRGSGGGGCGGGARGPKGGPRP